MFIMTALIATQLAVSPPPKHRGTPVDSSSMTLVEVQNDRSVPVAVYLQDEWGESKLGVVPADSTVTLRVKDPLVNDHEIDIFVQPRGQPDEDTGTLEIHRGEHLGVVVPPRR